MNRLTEKTEKGYIIKLDNPLSDKEARQQLMSKFVFVVNKLAEYENTGLEPCEVEKLQKENTELKKLLRLRLRRYKNE